MILLNIIKKIKGLQKIHLKFDTGMTRLGFNLKEADVLWIFK